jgi:hypothetical protein
VIGPNMLFDDCDAPGRSAGERELCRAASCRLQFTESAWYRELILAHCGPAMKAPVVLWPYPLDPLPGGPTAPRYDLLIYEKSGFDPALPERLARRWPASVRVRYGRYQRAKLAELARRSRTCVYLSGSDRGPLALTEVLTSGCPAVGVPRGSPWLADSRLGRQVATLDFTALCDAIGETLSMDRDAVRAAALERFAADAVVQTVLRALDAARWDG